AASQLGLPTSSGTTRSSAPLTRRLQFSPSPSAGLLFPDSAGRREGCLDDSFQSPVGGPASSGGVRRRPSSAQETLSRRCGLEAVPELGVPRVRGVSPVRGVMPFSTLPVPAQLRDDSFGPLADDTRLRTAQGGQRARAPAASPGPSCLSSLRDTSISEVASSPASFASFAVAQEIEADLGVWAEELARPSAPQDSPQGEETPSHESPETWTARMTGLRSRLEALVIRGESVFAAGLVLPIFLLCGRLTSRAAAEDNGEDDEDCNGASALLRAMLVAVTAAADAFLPPVLQQLGSKPAVLVAAVFRSVLQTLAQLQHLSRSPSERVRKAAAPVLMELPPLLARLVDSLEAPGQLVAWIRVASEVLSDEATGDDASNWRKVETSQASDAKDVADTRRWALRFCARCVERCLPSLRGARHEEFCAWEVFSELSKLYERRGPIGHGQLDHAWTADCNGWIHTLEDAAQLVSRLYPAQAREFLLLANCTGSPLPGSLGNLLDVAAREESEQN
ncbi:unnamed protein product, partial [Polarella glacialis]